MKRFLSIIVLVFSVIFVNAQEAADLVNQANAAVESKDYVKAVELFEKVLATPDHGQDETTINNVLNQLRPVVAKEKAKEAVEAKDYQKAAEIYKAAIADFPDDASIVEQAGVRFYNAGITSYKGKAYLEAVKCFTAAEMEFKYEKAAKYKTASLKKVAEGLAAEGKMTVDDVDVCSDNKDLLLQSLAKVYFDEGYELYTKGAAILTDANEKVNAGEFTTADDKYKAELEKAKAEFKAAVPVLEKSKELDPSNDNVEKVLSACKTYL